MIHYHGSPLGGKATNVASFWVGRHAMVSFFRPDELSIIADVTQSFVLDNGAFSFWRRGAGEVDFDAFVGFAMEWRRHPSFDWCLIPDKIDGTEHENRLMLARWREKTHGEIRAVPVWHLHESLNYLRDLMGAARVGVYSGIALGSSGQFATPRTNEWWARMEEAMGVLCDDQGRPYVKIHGLRMLDPAITRAVPLSSADSTNAVANGGTISRFGIYPAPEKHQRSGVIAERIEREETAKQWIPASVQFGLDLA